MDFSKFDVRVLERKMKRGEITEKEYKKHLESLEENKEFVEMDEDAVLKDAGFKKKEY